MSKQDPWQVLPNGNDPEVIRRNFMILNQFMNRILDAVKGELHQQQINTQSTMIVLPYAYLPRTTTVNLNGRGLVLQTEDSLEAESLMPGVGFDTWDYREVQNEDGEWKIIELRRTPPPRSVIAVHGIPNNQF